MTIVLNRPEARNAVNGAVAEAIEASLDAYEADDSLWAAILTGSGTVFSAGADLKEVAAGRVGRLSTERGGFGGLVRRQRSKPLIAAVNGAALAGGCELMLSCDIAIAADSAFFGLPEVKRSLVAAAGGVFRLPRAVGRSVAMEMILTGDPIDASRALELGLVNRIVPGDELLDAARALASRIVANAPLAVQASRRIAERALLDDDESLWRQSAQAIREIMQTEDFQEGPRAFVEKRPPLWKGR
ncbi:MAG: enoyl-CoA hydratase/isomerase family protein [Gammaproteobacteria bacterium]|nr:enoyl-CoA hydratase/isomerase family protein [Gammaproteobacteria bacterium]